MIGAILADLALAEKCSVWRCDKASSRSGVVWYTLTVWAFAPACARAIRAKQAANIVRRAIKPPSCRRKIVVHSCGLRKPGAALAQRLGRPRRLERPREFLQLDV